MLTGLSLAVLRETIGHDGSEVIWPDMPEPYGRIAFDMQELTDAALAHGFGLIRIVGNPLSTSHMSKPPTPVYPEAFEERFEHYLNKFSGILTGTNAKGGHAVAWDQPSQQIYDPDCGISTFDENPLCIDSLYICVKI